MIVYKYCANGNDFLIFHTFAAGDYSQLARTLCHRYNGIGADGLVVLLPYVPSDKGELDSGAESSGTAPKIAYRWDFYNADGSRANMCGNASRCVAHYAYYTGLAPAKHAFITSVGCDVIEVEVGSQDDPNALSRAIVASNLGRYRDLRALDVDSCADSGAACGAGVPESLRALSWHYIDTGVPHVVCFVPDHGLLHRLIARNTPASTEMFSFMRALRQRYNANVNLAYAKSPNCIYLATYERGVEDITLACGTGMAAVLLVGHIMLGLDSRSTLIPPSGDKLCLWCERIELESRVDSALDSSVDSALDSGAACATHPVSTSFAATCPDYPAMRVFLQGEVRPIAVCQTC